MHPELWSTTYPGLMENLLVLSQQVSARAEGQENHRPCVKINYFKHGTKVLIHLSGVIFLLILLPNRISPDPSYCPKIERTRCPFSSYRYPRSHSTDEDLGSHVQGLLAIVKLVCAGYSKAFLYIGIAPGPQNDHLSLETLLHFALYVFGLALPSALCAFSLFT